MKRKIIYGIMGGVVLLEIGLIIGVFYGMFIGGNYLTEFEFAGGIGPEAVGNIGLIIGAATGGLLGVWLGVKIAENEAARVYGKYLVISFSLSIASLLFLLRNIPDEPVTLQQVQTEADFTIYEPTYVPENVRFGDIEWVDTGIKETLYLTYFKKTPVFELTESKLTELEIDPNSTEVDISGSTGYLYKQGDTIYLTWPQNGTELTLTTKVIGEEKVLKIARSMKKY
ncbi:DUF4367 domain-containing protein [Jeotgalibaca sp. A122]|uniref:DUF4367 domain-containing protein n=1 Tax=Jeotgalibaca sp. A122 TaxID=3457322 RepID=UPI003FCF3A4B